MEKFQLKGNNSPVSVEKSITDHSCSHLILNQKFCLEKTTQNPLKGGWNEPMEETVKECSLRYCYTLCAISNNERLTEINCALRRSKRMQHCYSNKHQKVWFHYFTSSSLYAVPLGPAEPNIILGITWLYGNLSPA